MENRLVENSTFTVTRENRFCVKVKHNGSQYCCAISYLYWIVISINCSTRLKVFQYPERKNIKKIEEKRKKKIYRPS